MRIAAVEVDPYALPFSEPYVTARGRLERREMLLLRLRDRRGSGRPRRGGAARRCAAAPTCAAVERGIRKGTRRLRRAELSDFAGEQPTLAAVDAFIHAVAGRRIPAPAKAAIEMALFDLAGRRVGAPAVAAARRDRGGAGPLQRDPGSPAIRPTSPPTPSAGRSDGFATLQAEARHAGTTSPRCARCARRSGPRRGSGSTRTARGAPTRRSAILSAIEPLGIELAEQPVASTRRPGDP